MLVFMSYIFGLYPAKKIFLAGIQDEKENGETSRDVPMRDVSPVEKRKDEGCFRREV